MNPWPVEADVPEVHLPRPGHADLAGVWKFGFSDVRNVLERASARETAARVAGGGARQGVPARGRRRGRLPRHADRLGAGARRATTWRSRTSPTVDESPVRCLDAEATRAMVEEINVLRKRNESLGGIFELRAFGLVPGLGSHVSWEERLDGRIGMALLSIQALKGVGLGDGFDLAGTPGSDAHDEIFYDDERGYYRETNHSGGLEGGMTTGEPLVVRCAMKPLPTLTKPLRSVDVATRRARPGAARADGLLRGARGGRRGGGDAGDRARRRLPGEVRRRPHRRRAGGARRLRTADRVEAPAAVTRARSSSSASWGPGRRPRPRAAARSARARSTPTAARGALGGRSRTTSPRTARRVPRGRGAVVCELLDAPPGPVSSRGGACPPAGARRSPPHRRAARRRPGAWQRAGGAAPLARDRARFVALHAERRPLYDERRRRAADSARDACRRAACGAPPGARLAGRGASATTRLVGHGVLDGARAVRARVPRHRRDGRRATATRRGVATLRDPAGRGGEDLGAGGRVLRALARGGHGPRRPRARARRRRGGRPRRLLRRDLPARRARRPAADDARRPGRLGLRRQDGRRPAGGQELRRRLPPARGRARRSATLATLPPAELAAGWAEVVKTALIAGGPLWERVRERRRRARPRPRAGLRADEARRRRRGRARRRAAARCSTSATRSGTRSRRRRATRATATGRRSALGLLAALTLSGQPALRAEVAALLAARGLPTRARPGGGPAAVLAATQRDKKRRGGRVGFVLVEAPGDVRRRPRRGARRRGGRSGRVAAAMRNRVAVMHGVNLDALDRRPAEHYGGLTFARLEQRIEQFARALGLDARFFQSNLEGEFVEELHRAPDYADGLAAQPGRLDALRVGDPRRARALRAARRRGPPLRRQAPRGVPRRLRARGRVRGDGQRRGRGGLPHGARAAKDAL